ncbi:ankyrin [Fragilariopsis cylindrus CCMP1102]|uniref:Ankyrin n=1 Tax=Fragilariopsis cylindrus CCMP1102 TaxID=635003 RepID=A0A1E7FQ88_9STRA|nr:ankyrin [Fragilariopsis cylindrus CCMP1102]|eukprot:OEU20331.1 ankyrin [Fragilariopsis cylindrus CCMP1102]
MLVFVKSWWQQRKKDRALIKAVQKGDLEEVVHWADRGANIKCEWIALRDGFVRTNLLLEAIIYSHASIVQYILDRESSLIYLKDGRGFTPFHRAILRYDIDIDILRILLREQDFISKDLVNSCRKGGHSILSDVVNSYGSLEHTDLVIDDHLTKVILVGANFSHQFSSENWLTNFNHIKTGVEDRRNKVMGKLCLLLDAEGIDVNTTTNDGWTALHIACAYVSFEMIGALIKSPGIRIDIKTSCKGYTALDLLLKKRDSKRYSHMKPKFEDAIALFNMKKC